MKRFNYFFIKVVVFIFIVILIYTIIKCIYKKDREDYKIPKKIYQTHKSIDFINSKPKLLEATNSWKKHKDFEYHFFNNEECREFIKTNFSEDVYTAYKKLPLNVMKADLWRYCVIYINGGIYADADTVCVGDPNILITNDTLLNVVPEYPIGNREITDYFCQWVFSAPPKSAILKYVIDLCVERILKISDIKENNIHEIIDPTLFSEGIIHELTGPAVFTVGIEKYLKDNNIPLFEDKRRYETYKGYPINVYPMSFHQENVTHLFSGSDNDGWRKEKEEVL